MDGASGDGRLLAGRGIPPGGALSGPGEHHHPRLGLRLLHLPRRHLPATLETAPIRMKRSGRSEEHTSELQSLMRISYAVFCLKKKKETKTQHIYSIHNTYKQKEHTQIER